MVKKRALFYVNIGLLTIYFMYILWNVIVIYTGGEQIESPEQAIFLFLIFFGIFMSYFIILAHISIDYKKRKFFSRIYITGEIIEFINWIWPIFYGWTHIDETTLPVIIMASLILIIGIKVFLMIRKSNLELKSNFELQITAESSEKLKDILNVSNRIKLERVQNVLNLDDKSFDEKIIEWAKEFSFRIDGEYLIVTKESISEFIEALDKKFIEWEKREKDKADKL